MSSFFTVLFLFLTAARAFPALLQRQVITPLSQAQVDFYDTYSHFAAASQCNPSTFENWECGVPCKALAGFNVTDYGGDDGHLQYWFVGYYAALNAVIVVHQGTDISKLDAIFTGVEIDQVNLDTELFPGLSDAILVHKGFRDAHAKVAMSIASATQTALSTFGTNAVICIGFSYGAALGLLDTVLLSLHLPAGTTIKSVLYGLPRVGNQDFANYVDANTPVVHISNKKDPIPILPGMMFGYVHPSGEIHITKSDAWAQCGGQDNSDSQCTVGSVDNILFATRSNHFGPYNDIWLTCDEEK